MSVSPDLSSDRFARLGSPDAGHDAVGRLLLEAAYLPPALNERLNGGPQDGPTVKLHAEEDVAVHPDGSRTVSNPDGSTVYEDPSGRITKIERSDKTEVDCFYDGKGNFVRMTDGGANGSVEWTKDTTEDRWRSMSFLGAQRLNMAVNERGDLTFGNVFGTTFIIHGDNTLTRKLSKGSTIESDERRRLTSVTRRDGSQVLCEYANGKLDQITEKNGNRTVVWHRRTDDTWTSNNTAEVRKHFTVADSGNLAYISESQNNVVHIDYADGNKRDFEYANGQMNRVVEQTSHGTTIWQRQGNTDVWLSGNTQAVRHRVNADVDGDYSYIDSSGYKHIFRFDETEDRLLPVELTRTKAIADARDNLLKTAESTIANKERLKHFEADMDTFERRAITVQLTDAQVAKAFDDIANILKPTAGNAFIPAVNRQQLAEETLHHVAKPRTVDQGDHNTCGAASAQVIVCETDPDKFTNLIRQVADTGEFVTTAGKTVAPDRNSLRPDFEAQNHDPYDESGERSYASQIFQIVGINSAYAALGYDHTYIQQRPQTPEDTGERVKYPDGHTSEFDGMNDAEVQALSQATTGHELTILRRGDNYSTEKQLSQQILDLQRQGKLPAILWVHTKNEPFYSATGHPLSGPGTGGHYVTLWDIDRKHRVLVDNQWGQDGDYTSLRRLPLSEVFGAGKP